MKIIDFATVPATLMWEGENIALDPQSVLDREIANAALDMEVAHDRDAGATVMAERTHHLESLLRVRRSL